MNSQAAFKTATLNCQIIDDRVCALVGKIHNTSGFWCDNRESSFWNGCRCAHVVTGSTMGAIKRAVQWERLIVLERMDRTGKDGAIVLGRMEQFEGWSDRTGKDGAIVLGRMERS